jgi:hypothetical protein
VIIGAYADEPAKRQAPKDTTASAQMEEVTTAQPGPKRTVEQRKDVVFEVAWDKQKSEDRLFGPTPLKNVRVAAESVFTDLDGEWSVSRVMANRLKFAGLTADANDARNASSLVGIGIARYCPKYVGELRAL